MEWIQWCYTKRDKVSALSIIARATCNITLLLCSLFVIISYNYKVLATNWRVFCIVVR